MNKFFKYWHAFAWAQTGCSRPRAGGVHGRHGRGYNLQSHNMCRFRKYFTLIEVVVALAILTAGLVGALALTGSSMKKLDKAAKRWEHQHLLAQAAEFLILKGFADSSIPDEFFPNNKYKVNVEVKDPEGLPSNMEMEDSKWQLKTVVLKLFDDSGTEVDSLEFDRVIYNETEK